MEFTAYNSRQHKQVELPASGLTLGRDKTKVDFVIDDPHVSEIQLRIVPTEDGQVTLENHGRSIVLQDGRRIHGGNACQLTSPSKFWVGETCFSLESFERQYELTTLPAFHNETSSGELAKLLGKSPAATTLIHWLQSIGNLQRSVGGSQSIFQEAAHAAFDPGGLDFGLIIECKQDKLEIAASFIANPELGIAFDRSIVEKAIHSRQTLFHDPTLFDSTDCQLAHAAVTSPIFDEEGNLVAFVYGARCRHRNNYRQGIRPLEAQFIQVIAECVTAGMVRLAQEADAARTRVQFEQVFSPKLVESLQRDPKILEGHEKEVTVMFCDMRASTMLSDRLPPRDVYNVLGDVMDQLTERIMANDGVVIDYYGDGLAAFWNAPFSQPEHAELAVKSALEIIESLPDLNHDWREYLGRNIQVGIGIHTGIALVGNAGSKRRMKYGPRGRTVNLASRIESATSTVGVPILLSRDTWELVESKFVTRRAARLPLKGFDEPFDLYQPFDPNMDVRTFQALRDYESALERFENGEYAEAMDKLVQIELAGEGDSAVEFLIQQSRELLKKKKVGRDKSRKQQQK